MHVQNAEGLLAALAASPLHASLTVLALGGVAVVPTPATAGSAMARLSALRRLTVTYAKHFSPVAREAAARVAFPGWVGELLPRVRVDIHRNWPFGSLETAV